MTTSDHANYGYSEVAHVRRLLDYWSKQERIWAARKAASQETERRFHNAQVNVMTYAMRLATLLQEEVNEATNRG